LARDYKRLKGDPSRWCAGKEKTKTADFFWNAIFRPTRDWFDQLSVIDIGFIDPG